MSRVTKKGGFFPYFGKFLQFKYNKIAVYIAYLHKPRDSGGF